MGELDGRRAWITGGSSGIGRATVERLRQAGADIVVFDRQPPLDATPHHVVDVAVPAAVEAAVGAAARDGGWPDLLVNSAGIGPVMDLAGHDPAVWDAALAVNLSGTFHVVRLVLPAMCRAGFGRIVNLASGTAFRVGAGKAAYGASKAGVVALTKAAAAEGAGHGVTVNVIAPGLIDTPMTRANLPTDEAMREAARSSGVANPVGEALRPEDVAHVVWFLCLPASHGITGQSIHVNNGSLML